MAADIGTQDTRIQNLANQVNRVPLFLKLLKIKTGHYIKRRHTILLIPLMKGDSFKAWPVSRL